MQLILWPNEDSSNLNKNLSEINALFTKVRNEKDLLAHKNYELMKVLCVVKNNLEKAIKNPNNLLDVVIDSINSCREVTPYYSADLGQHKIDPPISDQEKEELKKKITA